MAPDDARGPPCDHRRISTFEKLTRGVHGFVRSLRHGPPLRRSRDDRVIAGVAAGLGRRFNLDPVIVRIVFVVLAVGGGTGIVAYIAAWLLLRADDAETSIAATAFQDRSEMAVAILVGTVVIAGFIALHALGLGFLGGLVWPAALAAVGLTVIWRQADEDDRAPLARVAERLPALPGFTPGSRQSPRMVVLRVTAGVALVAIGVTVFLATNHAFDAAREVAVAAIGIAVGVGLVFGPWWWKLGRDLAEERRERVRSQERAEVASHLHDSVLQTLALIQRQAGDPRAVTRLARAQERELRDWLFSQSPNGAATFAAAIGDLQQDVEERHEVKVEAVTVGDCSVDDDISALIAASREAVVNAAKWSGVEEISVYAEVEPARVSVFVRDRGSGFDPAAVAPNRKGISESMRGRMRRHGGTCEIRTIPGEGTEVELTLPRSA